MREGDIESLRRRMKDEGKPIKSTVIRDKDKSIVYDVGRKGNVKIKEVVNH